jgi:hypothetical protein
MGGGDPKRLGDGLVVKLRPDATRGNADIWDTRDAVVALMEELDDLYALVAAAADFAAFKLAAGLRGSRKWIKLADMRDGTV